MDFGFTRLTGAERPNDASRNGQTIIQVTWGKGGSGKAEDAKLQDAGSSSKQWPGKMSGRKRNSLLNPSQNRVVG